MIWFVVQISQGNFAMRIRQKYQKMIMPENFDKNLDQKRGPWTPLPPPPPQKKKKIRFAFFVKIYLLENSK